VSWAVVARVVATSDRASADLMAGTAASNGATLVTSPLGFGLSASTTSVRSLSLETDDGDEFESDDLDGVFRASRVNDASPLLASSSDSVRSVRATGDNDDNGNSDAAADAVNDSNTNSGGTCESAVRRW